VPERTRPGTGRPDRDGAAAYEVGRPENFVAQCVHVGAGQIRHRLRARYREILGPQLAGYLVGEVADLLLLLLDPGQDVGDPVEPGETPREAALRELLEETGVRTQLLPRPAAVAVRSYHPDWPVTLGLAYAASVDVSTPLEGEEGQPVAWTSLDRDWSSFFPDDSARIRSPYPVAGGDRGIWRLTGRSVLPFGTEPQRRVN
jgi:hypothetical protein